MPRKRGSALIIGLGLVVLIMIFSLNLVKTITATQGNIQRGFLASQADIDLKTLDSKLAAIIKKPRPLNDDLPIYADYRGYIEDTVKEIWLTTGCPQVLTEDLGPIALPQFLPYYLLNEQNELETTTNLADYCNVLDRSYFVYPSDNTWQLLKPGASISVPVNQLGRTTSWENLTIRVQPACPNGRSECSWEERLEQLPELPDYQIDANIDQSQLLAVWELKVGEQSYGMSKGAPEEISRIVEFCQNLDVCRSNLEFGGHSELTNLSIRSQNHLNLAGIDLSEFTRTARSLNTDLQMDLAQILSNTQVSGAKIDLVIKNIALASELEVQIISDQPIFKYSYN